MQTEKDMVKIEMWIHCIQQIMSPKQRQRSKQKNNQNAG
jgi:hypothetical protein